MSGKMKWKPVWLNELNITYFQISLGLDFLLFFLLMKIEFSLK